MRENEIQYCRKGKGGGAGGDYVSNGAAAARGERDHRAGRIFCALGIEHDHADSGSPIEGTGATEQRQREEGGGQELRTGTKKRKWKSRSRPGQEGIHDGGNGEESLPADGKRTS